MYVPSPRGKENCSVRCSAPIYVYYVVSRRIGDYRGKTIAKKKRKAKKFNTKSRRENFSQEDKRIILGANKKKVKQILFSCGFLPFL